MWNAALRRVVRGEEDREREKRAAAQLRLRREAQQEAAAVKAAAPAAASSEALVGVDASEPQQQQQVELIPSQDEDTNDDDADDDDDDHVQRHLLSRAKSSWSCVEDSQQAFCLALSRHRRVFAVGERDGRLSVWDNVAIRVITRELDPTLVVVPEDAVGDETRAVVEDGGAADAEERDGDRNATESSGEATPEDGGDESATNDDGSVEADDDEEEDEEEEEEEEADGNTEEEDDDGDDDMDDDDEQEDEEREDEEKKSATVVQTGDGDAGGAAESKNPSPKTSAAAAAAAAGDGGRAGAGLSLEELRIVKTSLKVVTSCAWSCDTRWLFAGCEEKGNRRGRLCVWDVDAASIFATFSFDAAINCVSAHPGEPDLVLVSSYNSLPVLLNVRTRESTQLDVPTANATINTTVPANSRHPSLVVSAKFGTTGKWIYCVTSKSTVAIFDSATLECLHSATLSVVIQFIDLSVDYRETALILTSAKGIHEFAIVQPDGQDESSSKRTLSEVRLYSTGAVRAPWALCCFSDDESFVVGLPVVRHRHVGENGLYTWNRASGKVQHNAGVKDGVNSLAWDSLRDSILAVSTTGSLFVLEEEFTTTWCGPMYPAGYRLITDNELHAAAMDAELAAIEKAKREAVPADEVIDIFTIEEPKIGPSSAQRPPMVHLATRLDPEVKNELVYIPAIPIAHHHRKHHHAFHGHTYNEEKHFGLGQSIFEPLKVPAKPKSSKSKKKKTPADPAVGADGEVSATASSNKKKRVRSSIGSQKKRRR